MSDYCEDADCPCVMHGENTGNLRARVARLEELLREMRLIFRDRIDPEHDAAIRAALAEKE